jgi:hypothetical protein
MPYIMLDTAYSQLYDEVMPCREHLHGMLKYDARPVV